MVNFRIVVTVDPKNAERGTKRIDRALGRTAAKADKLRATLARTFAILGGVAVLTGGIRLLADYGQAMSTVQAVAKATNKQFQELSDTAQQLGITTRFSASQAAEGMVFLARSGLEVNEVMGTIESTLRLAQAGALDLGSASKITAETMRSFRLEASDAGRIVDVFALTANSANTNVAQLGLGMKFVGAIATGLGVSLETTTAAMAALSDAGLQASMAGTGLRRVMAELESPSSKLQKILKLSGLTVDDVKISSVGLVAALKELKRAGVDTGTGLQIFGQRGGPAFEILSNSIPKIEQMNLKLLDAEGTAKRVAEIMDLNLKGALLSLRSAWEGLILKIGDAGEESSALTGIVRTLTKGLRTLADNADIVAGVLKALIILIGARGLVGAVRMLTAAIAANPIGLFLTALSFGIALLISFKDEIRASTDGVAILGDVFAEAWIVIKEVIAGLKDTLIPVLESVGIIAEDTFGDMEISVKGVLIFFAKASDTITGIFKGTFDAVIAIWNVFPDRMGDVMTLTKWVIRNTLEDIVDITLAIFQTIGDVVLGVVSDIGIALKASALSLRFTLEGQLKLAEDQANTAADAVNLVVQRIKGIPETFAANKKALANIDLLPRVEITENAAEIGELAAEAFAAGFAGTTGAEDLVNRIFDGAERRAAARRAGEAGAQTGAPEEFLEAVGSGPFKAGGGGTGSGLDQTLSDFDKLNSSLTLENDLLERLITTRGAAGEALKAEAEAGIIFTNEEMKIVEAQKQENMLLKEKLRLTNEIHGPQEQQRTTQEALNQLLADGIINQEQYNQKLRETSIAADQASNSIGAGFSRGLERIMTDIEDVGGAVEDTLVNAFHNAEEALVQFVRTGEFSFEQFANALLDDITRIIIKLLILEAIQAVAGIGGVPGSVPTPKAAGGPVQGNRPFLVGEQGPELFVPQGAGNIIPADETSKLSGEGAGGGTTVVTAPAPEVNVNITNVSDPGEVPLAMDSPAGDKAVFNSIQRQKNQLKRLLV